MKHKQTREEITERIDALRRRNGTATCWLCALPSPDPVCKRCKATGATDAATIEYSKLKKELAKA